MNTTDLEREIAKAHDLLDAAGVAPGTLAERAVQLHKRATQLRALLSAIVEDLGGEILVRNEQLQAAKPIRLDVTDWQITVTVVYTTTDRCSRCGAVLDNAAPGYSVVAGGIRVCSPCLQPGEVEVARARGM